jgi:hypothetical protein
VFGADLVDLAEACRQTIPGTGERWQAERVWTRAAPNASTWRSEHSPRGVVVRDFEGRAWRHDRNGWQSDTDTVDDLALACWAPLTCAPPTAPP